MIDCKAYADEILNGITGYGHLAIISVGDDLASASYIKGKAKDCARVGFTYSHYPFADGVDEADIIETINKLNNHPSVTGIIVQLPLPAGYDADEITRCIAREKDADGFRSDSPFKPCTPEGIVYLLKRELGDLTGKHAVVIGRGKLVGKPLAKMLLDENMTVSVCHSKSSKRDLDDLVETADAVIVAIGKARAIQLMVWRYAVVVDCGVNRDDRGTLCGDVEYCSTDRYTPVPGGVGLLTRAMLMKHVERRAENG